jgi:hypothetical protein
LPEELRHHRVIVINMWSGVSPSGVDRDPLCVCAALTVDTETQLADASVPGYNGHVRGPARCLLHEHP